MNNISKIFIAIMFLLLITFITCIVFTYKADETSNSYYNKSASSLRGRYKTETGSYKASKGKIKRYDKQGNLEYSYNLNKSGTMTRYDKYGQKQGTYKKDSSGGIVEYDKSGNKVGVLRKNERGETVRYKK